MTEKINLKSPVTLSPNTNFTIEFDIQKDGYTALGIVGFSTYNRDSSPSINISGIELGSTSGKCYIQGRNSHQTNNAIIPMSAYVSILYIKK